MNKLSNKLLKRLSSQLASRPAGVTSLLFVLAISLVLIVMVAGIAALTVREQQQASNTELSNRALQTAEAGVKAAVAKLSTDPNYRKADCNTAGDATFSNISATGQTITCATVTDVFIDTYEGFLETDRTTQFIYDPTNSAGTATPSYLKLSWNAPSLNDVSTADATFGGSLYPATITNNIAYANAAMVEMNIVYWPKTTLAGCTTGATATGTCGFKNATLLFAPGNNNNTNNPIANTCPGGTYSCTTTNAAGMSGFSIATATGIDPTSVGNYNYAIRITPRYKSTHFSFAAYGTDGSAIAPGLSNKAQIDITAKVGNLYRRVKAEKIILPSSIETIGTSVLYAGRGPNDSASYGICKTAVVNTTGNSLVSGNIGPNCP